MPDAAVVAATVPAAAGGAFVAAPVVDVTAATDPETGRSAATVPEAALVAAADPDVGSLADTDPEAVVVAAAVADVDSLAETVPVAVEVAGTTPETWWTTVAAPCANSGSSGMVYGLVYSDQRMPAIHMSVAGFCVVAV